MEDDRLAEIGGSGRRIAKKRKGKVETLKLLKGSGSNPEREVIKGQSITGFGLNPNPKTGEFLKGNF